MTLVIRAKDEAQTVLARIDENNQNQAILLENAWYFEIDQINHEMIERTDRTYTCPYKGVCVWYDLKVPGAEGKNLAWVYEDPMQGYEQIAGRIAFYARETSATILVDESNSAS